MGAAKVLFQGFISKVLPQAFVDDRDDAKPIRLKRYGEVNLGEFDPNMYGYCEEGSLLVATTPTPGTGVTWLATQATYVNTAPQLYIQNLENPNNPNAKSLYLGWLKFMVAASPTSMVSTRYACVLDLVPRTITTLNGTVLVPTCPNGTVAPTVAPYVAVANSASAMVFGVPSSASRVVAQGGLGGFAIIGDEMVIAFGRGNISGHPGLTAIEAAGVSKRVSNAPPVVIGPGQNLAIHVWGLSQTANINPEVELVMWAR